MDYLTKLKETLISVLPIMGVVVLLHLTIAPLGREITDFLVGGVLLIVGLSVFLTGTEIGMTAVGEKLGSVLAHKKNLTLLLIIGFFIGFGVTFAEPDVNVLASQVHSLNPAINEKVLVFMIACGLGIFVDIGMLKILKQIKLKWVLIFFYAIVFIIIGFSGQKLSSIAFDASGATTGPLAVPFLLALGLGISSASQGGEENSFGLTGIASIGPILAVGLMGIFNSESGTVATVTAAGDSVSHQFFSVFSQMLKKTAIGFGPLALIILILHFTLLHFPKVRFRKICMGILYSFIGIVIFLTGVDYGFTETGASLGKYISSNYPSWVVVACGLVFGAIVVCAEPAVWVLTEQVQTVTSGRIKRIFVLVFLCIGVSLAVGLAMLRIIHSINFLYIAYIGIGISLVMSLFCPPLFTGIAFDSGGVASGPMSTTFLLSFAIGVSGSAEMGFGLVGMIAISPLIAIQVLGIIFGIKEAKLKKELEQAGGAQT